MGCYFIIAIYICLEYIYVSIVVTLFFLLLDKLTEYNPLFFMFTDSVQKLVNKGERRR